MGFNSGFKALTLPLFVYWFTNICYMEFKCNWNKSGSWNTTLHHNKCRHRVRNTQTSYLGGRPRFKSRPEHLRFWQVFVVLLSPPRQVSR